MSDFKKLIKEANSHANEVSLRLFNENLIDLERVCLGDETKLESKLIYLSYEKIIKTIGENSLSLNLLFRELRADSFIKEINKEKRRLLEETKEKDQEDQQAILALQGESKEIKKVLSIHINIENLSTLNAVDKAQEILDKCDQDTGMVKKGLLGFMSKDSNKINYKEVKKLTRKLSRTEREISEISKKYFTPKENEEYEQLQEVLKVAREAYDLKISTIKRMNKQLIDQAIAMREETRDEKTEMKNVKKALNSTELSKDQKDELRKLASQLKAEQNKRRRNEKANK